MNDGNTAPFVEEYDFASVPLCPNVNGAPGLPLFVRANTLFQCETYLYGLFAASKDEACGPGHLTYIDQRAGYSGVVIGVCNDGCNIIQICRA